MKTKTKLVEDFGKINFTNMTDIQLCAWIRRNSNNPIYITDAIQIAKCLKLAYSLGEIRAKAITK